MERDKLDKMLKLDSLSEAEKLTGKSYKGDDSTVALGMVIMMAHSAKKEDALKEAEDSAFRNTVIDYIRIIKSIGFAQVLKDSFVNEDGVTEHLYVFWNYKYSVMIHFDSYTYGDDGSWAKSGKEVPPPSVNSCKMLYNWIPRDGIKSHDLTSSGGFNEGIWVGDHDGREAIKHKFNGLLENGEFVTDWIEAPFLWLLSYMEPKIEGYNYEEITQDRISRLPERIRECILIEPENE